MLTLREAASAVGGRLIGATPDAVFDAVSTDSRSIERGCLFVALRGERFDGHAFALAAIDAGAVGAIVDRASGLAIRHVQAPLIEVEDAKAALGALAADWRRRFTIPVIGIAGSNGKTTTKEMTASILRAQFGAEGTLATQGNLNNDIGLPLTLLRLRASHRAAAIEVGMNHPGETAHLAGIARPTIALVNNAQREHQEFMKSVADVAAEHGALFASLPAGGTAVINADDAFADLWRDIAADRRAVVRSFGLGASANVRGTARIESDHMLLDIVVPEGEVATRLAIPGEHNVRNALAATAAATAAGASLRAVDEGLRSFAPVKGRLQVKKAANGSTLIDDTYNANPDSVRAAIDVLAGRVGIKMLVLGDMGEVGDQGPAFHREVGAYARERGIDHLLALGELSVATVAAFGEGAEHFNAIEPLIERGRKLLDATPCVLVKGSRFMRMERVVEGLAMGADACC